MKFKITSFLLVLSWLIVPFVFADETAGDYFYGIGTKFGRGLENTVTSLAEIPCTMRVDIKDQGGGGFFTGFGKGTVFMLRRMLIGVTEVGTFFIPMERTIPRVCQETKPAVS
ncbi:MAG TPA: exosortase system-associated protein, TIGR04073 family [Candidatus Omnitrophota bacterium]|nr:exosortase system-associated protein, TIGR04073 family [Candidatus Omnitrophota bacterium]